MPWARRQKRPIPSIGSPQDTYELNDYSKGMDNFVSNDKFPLVNGGVNMWRLAQDARIPTLGEYETRKGFDYYSDSAGLTQDQTITSTTGAADKSFNTVTRLAQKWTAGTSGSLVKLEVNLKNAASATGTVIVEHWTDVSGSPGVLVARSSIASSSLTGSYAYYTARFAEAPTVTATTVYWIVVYVQSVASGSYSWSSTTSATTAKVSANSGTTWSTTSYALNFKQHYATTGGGIGLHRAYKSDGTSKTIFLRGTTLYAVDDVTGALTTIKSGLTASASTYRFVTVNDIVYYVNGYDGYRKWDFTTESQVNSSNYVNLVLHKGLMFLNDATDTNKWVFSNFAEYEVFTSTDFIYVPSPKTGDPSAASLSLNGCLLIWTRNNKYILSGDDNATFQLDDAPDQKGTYTQETVTADKNFTYYLSDDGVYRSNGSEAQLLSKHIYEAVRTMTGKEKACLVVNKGRLYMWYPSEGSAVNDCCYVWNLNYGDGDVVESHDTDAFVSRAFTAYNDEDKLIVLSSKIGQIYWQELESNDYTNLGGDINYELDTHYITYSRPAAKSETRYWEPRFSATSGDYTVTCQYATDLADNAQSQGFLSLQGAGYIWGAASTIWGLFTWGTSSEVQGSLNVPGEYRRVQLRYKHHATRQPVNFIGQTLIAQHRRIK